MPSSNMKKSTKKKARWLKRHPSPAIAGQKDQKNWVGLKDDIVVVVMGQTGVGKSTFVNYLLHGKLDTNVKPPAIGEDLESCTVDLEPFRISYKGTQLVIVDTPGFDDTFTADSEILERIAEWLASSYSKDMKLGGVIYLHDMSQPRMLGTTRKNFEMFEVLCGNDAAKAIVLGMTKWEDLPRDVADKRERQLRGKFWEDMLKHGARMMRFEKGNKSAWNILSSIVESKIGTQQHSDTNPTDILILKIQQELVELEKILPSTTAGKKLRYTLEEVLQMQKKSANALKSQSGSRELSEELKEKLELIDSLARQVTHLSVPLWHRIMAGLFGKDDSV